ncbi:hypothetical protein C8R42DRAFT_726046 [Lentinula raphanica]|nr:hypothetical protein C8R42DRAFT_726046 [Lentinula raphanica]
MTKSYVGILLDKLSSDFILTKQRQRAISRDNHLRVDVDGSPRRKRTLDYSRSNVENRFPIPPGNASQCVHDTLAFQSAPGGTSSQHSTSSWTRPPPLHDSSQWQMQLPVYALPALLPTPQITQATAPVSSYTQQAITPNARSLAQRARRQREREQQEHEQQQRERQEYERRGREQQEHERRGREQQEHERRQQEYGQREQQEHEREHERQGQQEFGNAHSLDSGSEVLPLNSLRSRSSTLQRLRQRYEGPRPINARSLAQRARRQREREQRQRECQQRQLATQSRLLTPPPPTAQSQDHLLHAHAPVSNGFNSDLHREGCRVTNGSTNGYNPDYTLFVAMTGSLGAARRPYTESSIERHDLGLMNIACSHCGALHWAKESHATLSNIGPSFGMCCKHGEVDIPLLQCPPELLLRLLTSNDHQAKEFRENIAQYNSALAFTSVGVSVDDKVNHWSRGPPVFRIHGELKHFSGSLLPCEGKAPSYAHIRKSTLGLGNPEIPPKT